MVPLVVLQFAGELGKGLLNTWYFYISYRENDYRGDGVETLY